MIREPLPVDEILPAIRAALLQHSSVVVQAPTGAGKTTRVPPALTQPGVKPLVLVEPRRLAARAAARRMAAERGESVGQSVGYHVRFDRCASAATNILVATPGILLQQLHADPFLERYGTLIFDEFHERGLDNDLALGLAKLIQQTVRPDLQIVAMSATLAAKQVADYLGGCPIIASAGRMFPVDIRFAPKPAAMPWPEATAAAVGRLLKETQGDILVFLPGWAEIRQTARELAPWSERGIDVRPLHGDLSSNEQDAAISAGDRRKVVLATNVAETSVTVEGVTGVVDTGLARELRFDPAVGLDRLEVVPISQASADQRAGRAGRTQPGVCIRLWNESNHRGRAEHTLPEVLRVDLAGAVLHLLNTGETAPKRFPWPQPPAADAIERAMAILQMLGAVHENAITDLGRHLARLPVHPRLGRMLIEGAKLGHAAPSALAAALLAERDPFRRLNRGDAAATESDLVDRVEVLETFARSGNYQSPLGEIDRGAAHFILRARDQLARAVEDVPTTTPGVSPTDAVCRALLAAFPDRVCRRRNPGGRKGVMVGGRGVRLDARSGVTRPLFFLAVDVDAGQHESLVRMASGIERDWLAYEHIRAAVETEFDDQSGRLLAWKRVRYMDLILEETPTQPPDGAELTEALITAAIARPERVVPAADSPAARFALRVRCLNAWRPQWNLPALDDLSDVLTWLAPGCRSLDDLRNADWLGAYRGRLTYEQLQAVEREAPERLTVPAGRAVEVQYELGKPPVLAARIQELFGWTETPRIAGGTVPVVLHLLAPNNRPQQVTQDLASFWANTYPLIRKELRVRYPKHAWPEDPLTAQPESRPKRKA